MVGRAPSLLRRLCGQAAVTALAVAAVAFQFVVGATPAFAFTCGVDGSGQTAIITMDASDPSLVGFVRNGNTLMVDQTPCGDVTMLRTVTVDLAHQKVGLDFDLRGGPFGDATHDVRFDVIHPVPQQSSIGVFGTDGNDAITIGSRRLPPHGKVTAEEVDFDAASEPTGVPTDDVVFEGLPGSFFLFDGKGDDRITGQGTGVGQGSFRSGPARALMTEEDAQGADTFVGGNGNDQWVSTQPFDFGNTFSGGGGADLMVMSSRSADVSVSLDDIANDGLPGEADDIGSDVEVLDTGGGDDTLIGTVGHQTLIPGGGDNRLFGGPGPDLFVVSELGADDVHGGRGIDTATYDSHQNGVDVTLDGVANDGGPFEGDNVRNDVERVDGSNFADHLTGNDGPNRLFGFSGNDVIRGMGGNDVLSGGAPAVGELPADGSDTLFGGPGVDTVLENSHTAGTTLSVDGKANDVVNGHPGQGVDNIETDVENVVGGPFADHITGDPGPNVLTGGQGNDILDGLAGGDRLVGGPGNDALHGGGGTDVCLQGPGTGPAIGCEH
jgi:Ca2+-binding RTX toxin-like protein